MEEDRLLFAWARHYAFLIALSLLIGLIAAPAYLGLVRRRSEAWTYVIETQPQVPALQVGLVTRVVFQSPAVYLPVMKALRIRESPERFLGSAVELRAVPGTVVLIVIGRARDMGRAKQISGAMANALVGALAQRGHLPFFTVFDRPQAAPSGEQVSLLVAIALGCAIGLCVGIAAAVLHYRAKRPILTPDRASGLVAADHATLLKGTRPHWLGVLRGSRKWQDSAENRERLAALARGIGAQGRLRVELPGGAGQPDAEERRLSSALGIALDPRIGPQPSSSPDTVTIVVCGPSTAELDLELSTLGSPARSTPGRGATELLWVG